MRNIRLGMNISGEFGRSLTEQIPLLRETGFEAFFSHWKPGEDLSPLREAADGCGMLFQSVHAPFGRIMELWESEETGQTAADELVDCVHVCAANEVPIMVCHTVSGFKRPNPTARGIENFGRVVRAAGEAGVKIAFENLQGEEYLAVLMDAFSGEPHVGFCWDTGHEHCYNCFDIAALYGERMIATHLNDNLGVWDFGGEITCRDDLHLMPFDGAIDWADIAHRLNRSNYQGILTFEVKRTDTGRHENDAYRRMSTEEFFAEVYKRACRFARMVQRDRGEY